MYEWIAKWTDGERTGSRVLLFLIGRLPDWLAYSFCSIAAWLLLLSHRGLRSSVTGNMEQLLGGTSSRVRGQLRAKYYRNLCATLYELLIGVKRIGTRPGEWNPIAGVEGEAHLRTAFAARKGVIVFAPHVGNFFVYYWYLSQHYDCLTVATAGSKELQPIYQAFAALGCRGLDYDETPPLELIRKLKHHLKKGGVVFILGDFYRPNFPEAEFFSRKTRSPRGAAMLALELNVPLIPMAGHRRMAFDHWLQFHPPLHLTELYSKKQLQAATNNLNDWMEQVIRERPEQWFYWFQAEERWIVG